MQICLCWAKLCETPNVRQRSLGFVWSTGIYANSVSPGYCIRPLPHTHSHTWHPLWLTLTLHFVRHGFSRTGRARWLSESTQSTRINKFCWRLMGMFCMSKLSVLSTSLWRVFGLSCANASTQGRHLQGRPMPKVFTSPKRSTRNSASTEFDKNVNRLAHRECLL